MKKPFMPVKIPAMTGMAMLIDVDRKGPTKLIRQIE